LSSAPPIFPGNWILPSSDGKSLSFASFLQLTIPSRFEKRIYIPLPDVEARKRMFELNVGSTPCQLSQKDYRKLAEMTEGWVPGFPRAMGRGLPSVE
jgi:hypothetical protein